MFATCIASPSMVVPRTTVLYPNLFDSRAAALTAEALFPTSAVSLNFDPVVECSHSIVNMGWLLDGKSFSPPASLASPSPSSKSFPSLPLRKISTTLGGKTSSNPYLTTISHASSQLLPSYTLGPLEIRSNGSPITSLNTNVTQVEGYDKPTNPPPFPNSNFFRMIFISVMGIPAARSAALVDAISVRDSGSRGVQNSADPPPLIQLMMNVFFFCSILVVVL
mmetsp:Transcript_4996/g.7361  ORF Transcript_4996/g.7361 Transcript_4996/m.7361 type:complete len:222 (-) Transcript_4996:70-735(-)